MTASTSTNPGAQITSSTTLPEIQEDIRLRRIQRNNSRRRLELYRNSKLPRQASNEEQLIARLEAEIAELVSRAESLRPS